MRGNQANFHSMFLKLPTFLFMFNLFLSLSLSLSLYLFYVYEYTVAVFRHTRRGPWIPL
jgi:hypothetical protein